MATVSNGEHEDKENGDQFNLDKFLKERQSPNPSRDRIVHNSQEKFSKTRQNSADASCLSRSQKERKLDDFLKRKRRRRKKVTINEVRAETAKILEEFLQEQLAQQSIQTSSPEYQRFVEVSVSEKTTPSGDNTSYAASGSNILLEDSIPYADESDGDLRKTESVPHEGFCEFQALDSAKGLPIHHDRSRSAPHSQNEAIWIQSPGRKQPGTIRPPPPPPPGTPHSPSENGSSGSISRLHPVPYTGKTPDSSVPSSSHSLNTFSNLERKSSPVKKEIPAAPDTSILPTQPHSHSRSTTPITDSELSNRSPTRHSHLQYPKHIKAGSETSSDTDSEGKYHTHGRRKKSMFKKAQHRVQNFFRKKKNRETDSQEDEADGFDASQDEKKPKHRRKPKKHDKGKHATMDMPDYYIHTGENGILEESHTHRNKQIHQTHSHGDGRNVLRSEESTETVDITKGREKKHTEKKLKMKESSGHDGGVLSKLKRLTSRDKGKHSMKESRSADFKDEADGSAHYSRAVSIPERGYSRPTELALDEPDHGRLQMYSNQRGFEFSNVNEENDVAGRHITATQVVCREGGEKDIRRHSSHLDIVDHSGKMVERMYFDAEGNALPRNESFVLSQEDEIHERVVYDHGRRKIIRDITHREHIEITEQDENEKGAAKELSGMTEEEKDELYGKIASRLASIGDNLMAEQEEKSRSASRTPESKLTDDQKSSPEQEFEKTTLTPLEIELRDELRKVADDMDAMLAANARQAALHISGLVTYNHFKNIVQESVGQEEGWAQIAAVFQITKRAVKLAGASGALAMQIKEMSLKYIEDKFANWIVGQGGWETMLSEDDSETDSELD